MTTMKIEYCLIACLLPLTLWGQDKGIQDKELIIEKNKVLELSKANRNMNKMEKTPVPNPKTTQNYTNLPISVLLPPVSIVAKPYSQQKTENTDNSTTSPPPQNYVRVGFGNYLTPYLEAYGQLKVPNTYQIAAYLQHLSSVNGSVLENKSGASNNKVQLDGEYILEKSKLTGKIYYQRNGLYYYGYDQYYKEGKTNTEQLFQSYQNLGAQLGYEHPTDSSLIYKATLQVNRFSSHNGLGETSIMADANGQWQFSPESAVRLQLQINLMNFSNDFLSKNSINRNLIVLKPSYEYRKEQFGIQAGFVVAYDNDTVQNQKSLRLYPSLQLDYQLVPNNLQLYGTVQGNTQRITAQQLTQENPFLGNRINPLHTYQRWDVAVGVKGNFLQHMSYHIRGSYGSYQNMYFFGANTQDSAKFHTIYDYNSIGLLQIYGALQATIGAIHTGIESHFTHYATQSIAAPLQRPTWTNTVFVTYQHNTQVQVGVKCYNLNGIRNYTLKTTDNQLTTLPSILDISLNGTYHFLPQWAAFLQVNNLLGSYQRYAYYDTQGINALLGVQWRF